MARMICGVEIQTNRAYEALINTLTSVGKYRMRIGLLQNMCYSKCARFDCQISDIIGELKIKRGILSANYPIVYSGFRIKRGSVFMCYMSGSVSEKLKCREFRLALWDTIRVPLRRIITRAVEKGI